MKLSDDYSTFEDQKKYKESPLVVSEQFQETFAEAPKGLDLVCCDFLDEPRLSGSIGVAYLVSGHTICEYIKGGEVPAKPMVGEKKDKKLGLGLETKIRGGYGSIPVGPTKEEKQLVDGEWLDVEKVPTLPRYGCQLGPVSEDILRAPTEEEVSSLINDGERVVEAYSGRVEDVECGIVSVTLMDRSGRCFHEDCAVEYFHLVEPYPGMYFLSVETRRESSTGTVEFTTRVQAEKPGAIVIAPEEAESMRKQLEEERQLAQKYR